MSGRLPRACGHSPTALAPAQVSALMVPTVSASAEKGWTAGSSSLSFSATCAEHGLDADLAVKPPATSAQFAAPEVGATPPRCDGRLAPEDGAAETASPQVETASR
eukprot:1289990-Pyramimonas_sp.AAC.1